MSKESFNFKKAKRVGEKNIGIKVTVTSRLDPDVVDWLKEESQKKGLPYQTYMNSLLREAMNGSALSVDVIRKILQEELKKIA